MLVFRPFLHKDLKPSVYQYANELLTQLEQNSVSKIKLILEIRGKTKLNCELKRHLSPRTVGIIFRSLPLEGNGHQLTNNITYFETLIESGIDRPRKEFKKGDIAFLPANGSICFFSEDTISSKIMTPIGKITSETKILQDIKPGDVLMFYADNG
jgi:uncharacterized protein